MIGKLIAYHSGLSYRFRLTLFFLLIAVVLLVDFLIFLNLKNGRSKPKSLMDLLHDEMPVAYGDHSHLTRKAIFGNILENGSSSSLEQVEVFYNKTLYAPGVVLMVKGDLGDQLFQYACAYALSRRLRWPLYIYYTPTPLLLQNQVASQQQLNGNKIEFLLDHLKIPLDNFVDKSTEVAGPVLNFGKEGVLENTFRTGKRMPKVFMQLNGGFSSSYHKAIPYWRRYVDDFRLMFKPRQWAVKTKNLKKIRTKIWLSRESVAVHVTTDSTGYFPALFYEQAMKKMATILSSRGRAKPAFFLFFSSENVIAQFEEIEKKLGEWDFEMFYQASAKKHTSFEEFYLMGLCKHVIFLQSPLAWWVAYLKNNQGQIGMAPSFNPKSFGRPVRNGSSRFQVKLHGKVYDSTEWNMLEMESFGEGNLGLIM